MKLIMLHGILSLFERGNQDFISFCQDFCNFFITKSSNIIYFVTFLTCVLIQHDIIKVDLREIEINGRIFLKKKIKDYFETGI